MPLTSKRKKLLLGSELTIPICYDVTTISKSQPHNGLSSDKNNNKTKITITIGRKNEFNERTNGKNE